MAPALALGLTLALGACQTGEGPGFLQARETPDAAGPAGPPPGSDVEAPEQYQLTAEGIWDGRPSLGGIWVAHPDVGAPERVIIRTGGAEVVGALFRRTRESAGPPFQISSQAAAALEIPPGTARSLEVTALRKVPEPEPEPEAVVTGAEGIAAALANAPAPAAAEDAPAAAAETAAAAAPAAEAVDRPVVQLGVYPSRREARAASRALEAAGLPVQINALRLENARLWRVAAGPAATTQERDALLARARSLGYPAALAVER